jgi:hypothetical protein
MTFETVVYELKQIYGYIGTPDDDGHLRNRLTDEDITRWAKLLAIPRMTVCDRIAEYIARGFHSRNLEYPYCDAVANALWGFMIDKTASAEEEWSPFLHEVYDAFDQGEWPHIERLDEDPPEVHTRPLVAAIVAKLDSGNAG